MPCLGLMRDRRLLPKPHHCPLDLADNIFELERPWILYRDDGLLQYTTSSPLVPPEDFDTEFKDVAVQHLKGFLDVLYRVELLCEKVCLWEYITYGRECFRYIT